MILRGFGGCGKAEGWERCGGRAKGQFDERSHSSFEKTIEKTNRFDAFGGFVRGVGIILINFLSALIDRGGRCREARSRRVGESVCEVTQGHLSSGKAEPSLGGLKIVDGAGQNAGVSLVTRVWVDRQAEGEFGRLRYSGWAVLREQLAINHSWNKVILLNPLDHRAAFKFNLGDRSKVTNAASDSLTISIRLPTTT